MLIISNLRKIRNFRDFGTKMKFGDFQRKESQVKYEGQAKNELPAFTNRQRRTYAATANLRRRDDRRE